MLAPPASTRCELFLACPVVQKRGSSFQGDVGRLKVKAIGTDLGFGEESSAYDAGLALSGKKAVG